MKLIIEQGNQDNHADHGNSISSDTNAHLHQLALVISKTDNSVQSLDTRGGCDKIKDSQYWIVKLSKCVTYKFRLYLKRHLCISD